MKFEKYLSGFKEYLKSHQFSERTVETYCSYAKHFLSFFTFLIQQTIYKDNGSCKNVLYIF